MYLTLFEVAINKVDIINIYDIISIIIIIVIGRLLIFVLP